MLHRSLSAGWPLTARAMMMRAAARGSTTHGSTSCTSSSNTPPSRPAAAAPRLGLGLGRRGFASGSGKNLSVLGEPLETQPMPFNAAILDTDEMRVTDTSDFTTRLLVTVKHLKAQGKSSLWVRVHALNGHLLGVLGTFGFKCHHCEPETVVMNLWLKPSECKIPPYATHLVGVAGFCVNKKHEVLLVKEQSKSVSGWKLPGGYVNLGEEIGGRSTAWGGLGALDG